MKTSCYCGKISSFSAFKERGVGGGGRKEKVTAPAGYVNIFLMACMWLAEDLFVQPAREAEQGRVLLHPRLRSARRGGVRGGWRKMSPKS